MNKQLMEKDKVVPLVQAAKEYAGNNTEWLNFFDKFFLLSLYYFEDQKVTHTSHTTHTHTHTHKPSTILES